MEKLNIVPEAVAGCKVYCSKCNTLYSVEVHLGCPECGEMYLPPLPCPTLADDDDYDPFADDEDFKREFG